ncbi:type 1 fimbrial protein [Enterobacter cloacae]|nr:type 1 fimbrial protein [Enterobacter cloacae]
MKNFFIFLNIILGLLFYSSIVKAQCIPTNYGYYHFGTYGQDIVIQRDLPIGSLIYKRSLPGNGKNIFRCDNGGELIIANDNDTPGSATSVPYAYSRFNNGLAVRISNKWTPSGYYEKNLSTIKVSTNGTLYDDTPVTLEIFKTGPLTSDRINLAGFQTSTYPTNYFLEGHRVYLQENFIIRQVGCTSSSLSALSLSMGSVDIKNMTRVGDVGPRSSSASLSLDCITGTKVGLTLTGTTDNYDPKAIAITGACNSGIACGHATYVYMNDTRMTPGEKMDLNLSGNNTLIFSAAYVKTQDKVSAGVANATATLVFTYE